MAAVDSRGYVNCNTVYNVVLHDPAPDACAALVCLLNSRVVRWWFTKAFNSEEGLFPHIQKYQTRADSPACAWTTPPAPSASCPGWAMLPPAATLTSRRMEAICCEAFGLARPCFERHSRSNMKFSVVRTR